MDKARYTGAPAKLRRRRDNERWGWWGGAGRGGVGWGDGLGWGGGVGWGGVTSRSRTYVGAQRLIQYRIQEMILSC